MPELGPDYEKWRDELDARTPEIEPDGTIHDHGEAYRMVGDFDEHGETMEPGRVKEIFKEWREDTARRDFDQALDAAADRGKLQTEKGRDR
jgi:hypothetical protein